VVIVAGGGGVAEAAQVDGEHPVALGEQRDQFVEDPPGLREAVHQQHGRPGPACADVVQFGAVDGGAVVVDAGDGGGLHGSSKK
jgi:hypothetical protein